MRYQPVSVEQAEKYDNKFQSESDINVMFTGWGASVSIGKNVKFPKNKRIVVHSDGNVQIGASVDFNGCDIALFNGSEIKIGNKCSLGAKIFLNVDGRLDIGEGSTFGGDLYEAAGIKA